MGILETDIIKQAEMKEKLKIPQKNEGITRNQTTKQKSLQKDKHLSCPQRKILGTIHKVAKGRISTNGLENKKTHDNT